VLLLSRIEPLLAAVRQHGIRSMVLDLENTLVPYGASVLPWDAQVFLERVQRAGLSVLVASNASSSAVSADLDRAQVAYAFSCWKPLTGCLRKWCKDHALYPNQVLVVGDQVLTDGLLAVFSGARLLLVEPTSADEPLWPRMQRAAGRLLARRVTACAGLESGRPE
jgi:HAD superfamily phosphatase (TIGR01668 family)